MRTLYLIAREAAHRVTSSLLALLAIAAAVALAVAFFTAGDSSTRETTRLMRDIGYNLRIIPVATDMELYWRDGYSHATMPAELVQRFATRPGISYNHLIAMLQERIEWRDKPVLLTGIAQELSPIGKKKGSMIFEQRPGTLSLGYEVHRRLALSPGDEVELLGRRFGVAECLAEEGSEADVRVWVNLADAQALLGKPGAVNEIKALECGCAMASGDPVEQLRSELAAIAPEGKVIRMDRIARARSEQRRMSESFFAMVLSFALVFCGLWIAFLALLNLRSRHYEIGVLRALGHGSGRIAGLFLGKFALLGVLGAVLGFALGSACAALLGPGVFATKAGQIRVAWSLLPIALILAPLFAVAASFIPTVLAVKRDPATILQGGEEA